MRLAPFIVDDAAETLARSQEQDQAGVTAHAPALDINGRYHPLVSGPSRWTTRLPLELGISAQGVDTVITLNPMGELAIGLPLVFPRPGQTSPEEFWASILPRSFRALEILVAPRGETELRGLPMTPEDRPVTLSPNSFLLNGLVMVTLDAINAKMPVAQPVT